jgi:hypothetical protein
MRGDVRTHSRIHIYVSKGKYPLEISLPSIFRLFTARSSASSRSGAAELTPDLLLIFRDERTFKTSGENNGVNWFEHKMGIPRT